MSIFHKTIFERVYMVPVDACITAGGMRSIYKAEIEVENPNIICVNSTI
jgi:hypothetical protein